MRKGAIGIGVETAGRGLGDISGKGGETNIVVMNEAISLFAKPAPCVTLKIHRIPLGQPGTIHIAGSYV